MDIVILIIGTLGIMIIALIVTHLWVGIWDTIGAGLKKLFHIGKKETINWHTLEENQQTFNKSDVIHSTTQTTKDENSD